MDVILDELLGTEDGAAEAAALAVDVLGGGVDDDVGAEFEGMLKQGCREDIVDGDDDAGRMRDIRDRGDVDEIQQRIGRRLEEEHLRIRAQGIGPGLGVAAIDQGELDAEARTQDFDDVAARAEHGAGGDDVIAGVQFGQDRRRDGGHAGGRDTHIFRAFHQTQALFEHGDGGIGEAAILKPWACAEKAGFRLFGAVVDEALRQEKRFGRFAEL